MDKPIDLEKALSQLDPNDGETVLRPAVISGFVFAAGFVLMAFGFDLTEEQLKAISTFALFLVPIGAALWGRNKAWSQKSVAQLRDQLRDRQVEESN
jgi:hypothetical protein